MNAKNAASIAAENMKEAIDAMPDDALRSALYGLMQRGRSDALRDASASLMLARDILNSICADQEVFAVKQQVEDVVMQIQSLR